MYQRQKKSFNYDRIRIWCDLKQVFLFVSVGKCLELIPQITQVSQGISALTCWVLVHFFFIFGAIVVYGSQLVILRSGYLFTSYIPFRMLLQRFCLGVYGTNAGNLVLDLCCLKLMNPALFLSDLLRICICICILIQPSFLQICGGGRRSSLGGWHEFKEHWSHHGSALCHSLHLVQLHILALVPVSWIYLWPHQCWINPRILVLYFW